jgi:hypothetical protein
MEYLRDVLAGKKLALKNEQVNMVSVPRYKEFNSSELSIKALNDGVVQAYIPDPVGPQPKPISRRFLFNVSHWSKFKQLVDNQYVAA